MSWRAGNVSLMKHWADYTILWRALQLRAMWLPYQAAIQPDRMLSVVQVCEGLRGQAEFLQPPDVEEVLLRLLHHTVCLCEGTISGHQWCARRGTWNILPSPSMWMGVCSLLSPVVYDQLLHFVDVKGEVVFLAPLHQVSHLLPVGRLVIVGNQAYHGCVVSKLDDWVGDLPGHTLMSEQGVQC